MASSGPGRRTTCSRCCCRWSQRIRRT